ncbi:hypothetical protein ATCC90586_000222 [Pythium insidiosum]|nr:hypothetical protein ATCC90586_000222 [Pythium insidiosum]
MSSTGASSNAATSADGHHEKTAPSSSHGPPPSDAPRGHSEDDAEPDDAPEDAASSGADGGSALVRRPTSFQPAHALRFGLEVIARDDATGAVTSALCLFCKHFGREPKPGAKRRATTNFKYFKGTFRTDQYVQHHRLQHPVKWAAYEAASPKDKQVFFPRHVIPVDREVSLAAATVAKRRKKQSSPGDEQRPRHVQEQRMPATVDRVSESTGAEFDIPEEIASLFQSSSKWEPFSFKSCELREATVRMDERETTATDAPRRVQQVYHVVVPDSSSLALTLELCQAGLSVPQITRSLQAVDHHLRARGASLLAWEDLVQHYVELGCFRSLTMLASLLSKCWAFSISLHAVSSSSSECVDVRLHLCTPQTVSYLLTRLSIHALDILPQLLTILHPKWRDALLSVSVDGDIFAANTMAQGIRELRQLATHDIQVLWRGTALLHRALDELCRRLMKGRFAPTMTAIKGYILSQSELIESIGHPPATHAADETVIVARWLTERRVRVRKLLDDRQPSCRPPDEWWLSLAIFDWLADSTQHCLEQVSLACSSSWTQQIQFIMALVVVVEEAFHVHATAAETQQSDDSAMPASSSPSRSPDITARGVREFIPELGSFVAGLLTTLNQAGDLEPVLRTISDATTAFLWTLRDGLEHAKGCSEFEPLSSTPVQVYPHELAQLSGKEFAALVESAWPRLQAMHSDEQRDALEQEHQALKRAAREKDFLSALEDAATAQNIPADTPAETFTRAWGLTDGRFRGLHAFAGGLATLRFSCDSRATGASTTRHVNVVALDEAWTLDAQAPLHAAQCGSLERAIGSDM